MPRITRDNRDLLISAEVIQYINQHAYEAYTGRVTTGEVVSVVEQLFTENGLRFTGRDRGETYDAIREYGPAGEDDGHFAIQHHLRIDRLEGATYIDDWGQVA